MNKTLLTGLGAILAAGSLGAQTTLPNKITSDTTLTADQYYIINGYTYVVDGATLTIEPGVQVYANEDTGSNASALIITRGSKIHAQGTATDPIVFQPITARTTTLGADDTGMWGGVIILGNAKLNSNADGSWDGTYPTQDVEGMVPAAGDEDLINFGGDDDSDDSGVISYVSIRNAGVSISDGNEINGLTLGGVGSGTQIDHVEIFANLDDAIECFGGCPNLDHIVAAFCYDDSLDLDEGFRGSVQNYFVIQRAGENGNTEKGDKGGEWDGNDLPNITAAGLPEMLLKLSNATFIGMGSTSSNTAINIRHNGAAQVYNSIFIEYNKMIQLDKDGDNACADRYAAGEDIFKSNIWYSWNSENNSASGLQVTGDSYVTGYDTFFTGNGNQIVDPGLTVSRSAEGLLDVTPAEGSVAVTSSIATVPEGMTQTSYIGAFSPYYNWAIGWTKLYEDGYFKADGSWFLHPTWGLLWLPQGALDGWVYADGIKAWMWIALQEDNGCWAFIFE